MFVAATHSSMSTQPPPPLVYPAGHVPQVKEPGLLVQVSPGAQALVRVAHSSMSAQVTPSPENPLMQVQTRPPLMFEQTALALQPPLLVAHSSTSTHSVPSPVKPGWQAQL